MPTIKRRNRMMRSRGLSETQLEILLYGSVLLNGDGRGFQDDREEAATWRQYRTSLMAEWDRPGRRPAAFYRFDLRMGDAWPKRWHTELAALEERGLLTAEEILRVEESREELNPKQSGTYASVVPNNYEAFWTPLQLEEARFTAAWHGRRGRAHLEAKYIRKAESLSRLIRRETE